MTIIYSSNLDGELEPCGCTLEGDLGGIKRRATLVDELRKTSPELFLISSGGYIDYEDTAHLTDVQCESCHGAGREHVTSNGKMATEQRKWPKKRMCIQCHTRKNSPNFRLDSYWSRISH